MKNIVDVSLERIAQLATLAGYKSREVATVNDMFLNSSDDVMFTRFAYLIAKELGDDK
jgi:hypothetical protein